jgi:hypothetical protein
MNTTLTGQFVTVSHSSWNAFEDDKGRTVAAGESYRLQVLDDVPDEKGRRPLREVKVDPALIRDVDKFTFGTAVRCTCSVRSYRSRIVLTLLAIDAHKSAAA